MKADVREIVKSYLVEHGFDGLCNGDCGCALDDLFPCLEPWSNCRPGHRVPDPTGEVDYIISEKETP